MPACRVFALVLLLPSVQASAGEGDLDADPLMNVVDEALGGSSGLGRYLEYEVSQSEVGKQQRTLSLVVREKGEAILVELTAPPDLQGTKVLVLPGATYAYLPAFSSRVRRITADGSKPFMGMALSLDDLVSRYGASYRAVAGGNADQLVLTPRSGTAKTYSRVEMTLAADTHLPVELKSFAGETLMRTETRRGYLCDKSVCTAGETRFVDAATKTSTTLLLVSFRVGAGMSDDLFSKTTLSTPSSDLTLQTAGTQAEFFLEHVPVPSSIVVKVGARVEPPASWFYTPASNSITFTPGHLPAGGAVVRVEYSVPGTPSSAPPIVENAPPSKDPAESGNPLGASTLARVGAAPEYQRVQALREKIAGELTAGNKTHARMIDALAVNDLAQRIRKSARSATVESNAEGQRSVVFYYAGERMVLGALVPPKTPEQLDDATEVLARFAIETWTADPLYVAMKSELSPSEALVERDERRDGVLKSMKLIGTEIDMVQSLLAATPRESADRPKLISRLAEGNAELGTAVSAARPEVQRQLTVMQLVFARHHAPFYEPEEEATRKEELAALDASAKRASTAAIENYRLLESDHPAWCASKTDGCLDETLYRLGLEYERAEDPARAAETYSRLIARWPRSKYLARAHLALAELDAAASAGDSAHRDAAIAEYRKAAAPPAGVNSVWGFAHYRLASTARENGELSTAIDELKKTIGFAKQYPKTPHAKALGAAAQRDLEALAPLPKK